MAYYFTNKKPAVKFGCKNSDMKIPHRSCLYYGKIYHPSESVMRFYIRLSFPN